jgi:hypothetical protein
MAIRPEPSGYRQCNMRSDLSAQPSQKEIRSVHTPLASSPEAVREKDSIKEMVRLGSSSHEIAATDPSR